MDELEKVEKLRERANVSYEDARNALRACNGDMLDAMVYLETLGKVDAPKQAQYSTSYTESEKQYKDVPSTVREQEKRAQGETFGDKFKRFCADVWQKCQDIHFIADHKDNEVINVPLWGLILILIVAWHAACILFVISLFFDWRYRFESDKDINLKTANDAMNVASNAAGEVKESVKESFSDK